MLPVAADLDPAGRTRNLRGDQMGTGGREDGAVTEHMRDDQGLQRAVFSHCIHSILVETFVDESRHAAFRTALI